MRGYGEKGSLLSFEDTNYFLGRAMDVMDVGRGIEELLVTPNRPVWMKVPLEMEDRHGPGLPGLWGAVQERSGTVQRGLHHAADVDLYEVRSLASLMTWKATLAWLRMAGPRAALRSTSRS